MEYIDSHPTVCSALWGSQAGDELRSIMDEWRRPHDFSVYIEGEGELEEWYLTVGSDATFSLSAAKEDDLHTRFMKLAREWSRGTEKHSNLTKIVAHPAYLQIIGMGPEVIPEIIKLLKKGPDHWFVALQALTQGQDPAEGTETMQGAAKAWIKWVRSDTIWIDEEDVETDDERIVRMCPAAASESQLRDNEPPHT